jgi:lipopolysaccharide/colanic/teichoic acid biosynthesis glycosyltransferase
MRRAVDFAAAAAGLLVLSPLFLVIALLIRATSPGPVFHRGERVGKDGRLFRIYKFRSMRAGAEREGPGVTAAGDARVTRVGGWLRRTKLDELPQLINVLRGEMGLVGPRPEDPRYVALYTPEQRRVLGVRPGLTGAASVRYRNEEDLLAGADGERVYREVVMPEKLRIELEFLRGRSLLSDLRILLETVAVLFR